MFFDANGQLRALPAAWTDVDPPDARTNRRVRVYPVLFWARAAEVAGVADHPGWTLIGSNHLLCCSM